MMVPLVFLCYLFYYKMVSGHLRPPQFQVAAVKTCTVTVDERQQSLGATKGAWRPTKLADTVVVSGSCP